MMKTHSDGFPVVVLSLAFISLTAVSWTLSQNFWAQSSMRRVEHELGYAYEQWHALGGRLQGSLDSPEQQNAAAKAFLGLMLLPPGEAAAITVGGITVADHDSLASRIRVRTTDYTVRLAKTNDPDKFAMLAEGKFSVRLPK